MNRIIMALILLLLQIGLCGCERVVHIYDGELYDYSEGLAEESETIHNCYITIGSSGLLKIEFVMEKDADVNSEEYLDLLQNIQEYIDENKNDDGTINDSEFSRGFRVIELIITYENERFAYESKYYGGNTIYMNDKYNVIENFSKWNPF